MQGEAGIVQTLNSVLSNELVLINQTFLHARMCRNWGLSGLNEPVYKESIRAMKRADALIERILFLEGLPNLQHLGRLRIGEVVPEMLQCDLDLMTDCIATVRDGITLCEQKHDYVSRQLLQDILDAEENYYDWAETQIELMGKMGLANYLQSQAD
ncbi:bacterioferritin [Natronospirillum operosum]|uniref:Bacterioferritin n=1 Tax=Natronospirillum operosum TaxID=2759953 RepID=A0A4Z0W8H4_9GAMM|nr:bacterioferritin [Natronospirillum operosum]TGG93249.1 bacterioferritin [Natronospirillum operosum]